MAKITADEALQRLSSSKRKAKGKPNMEFVRAIGERDDNLYLFRQGESGIITTSDSELKPIVGESEDADFTQELPPCLEDWLDDYAREVEWWQNVGCTIVEEEQMLAANGRISVSPMIDSKWGQKEPYNDHLIFNGARCMTGCGATAAAQIMRYWAKRGYKRGCMPVSGYTTKRNKYVIEPLQNVTVFDYDNMPATKPKTDVQKKAVATLLEYVSKGFCSDYTPGGTGTYASKVAVLLKKLFRMGSKIRMIYASTGAAAFEETIYNELANGRPLLMAGSGSAGRHVFICDGYDAATDRYHFNWGWDGRYNGYFAMTSLNPWSYTFNSSKTATIGIQPEYAWCDVNKDGEISLSDVMQVSDDILNNKYEESADVNNDGDVSLTDAMTIIDEILNKKK